MNEFEANTLLTKAALVDARSKPNADRAIEWAERLPDVSLADAVRALIEHQRTADEPILPVHVLRILAAEVRFEDPDITDQVVADSRAREFARAGVTAAEFDAHENDAAWIREKFPWHFDGSRLLEVGPAFDEAGEPE